MNNQKIKSWHWEYTWWFRRNRDCEKDKEPKKSKIKKKSVDDSIESVVEIKSNTNEFKEKSDWYPAKREKEMEKDPYIMIHLTLFCLMALYCIYEIWVSLDQGNLLRALLYYTAAHVAPFLSAFIAELCRFIWHPWYTSI